MGYTTFTFLLFLCILTVLYYLPAVHQRQWLVLLLFSIVFYCYASLRYIGFLIVTILSTWVAAVTISRINRETLERLKTEGKTWDRTARKEYRRKKDQEKRAWLIGFLGLNLGILFVLKYSGFFASVVNDIMHSQLLPHWQFILPLGISFYTFQSVAYVVDVYNEEVDAEENLLKTALFLSFFPQIIQGPISFFDQLAHQLFEPHEICYDNIKFGLELMLWGYFKKLVIADRLYAAVQAGMDHYSDIHGTTVLFVLVLYSLQLYADFSAGIDISRGIARMLDIEMINNFRQPYFAVSINDFWRRWHISLGAFMKKYVFYPLGMSNMLTGMSRKIAATGFGRTGYGRHVSKVFPAAFASLIVFLLVGLWHGAGWKYIGFGIWNGGIIMLSILLQPLYRKLNDLLHIRVEAMYFHIFRIVRTYIIMTLSYVFDIGFGLRNAVDMLRKIFTDLQPHLFQADRTGLGIITKKDVLISAAGAAVMFLVSVYKEKTGKSLRLAIAEHPVLEWLLVFVTIISILFFGMYGPDYKAADFIYMQF